MRHVSGPDKEPMECPIAYMSPQEVWNNYCKIGPLAVRTQANSFFVHLNLLAKDPGVALARIVC